MADYLVTADEAEFAGYVDAGLWELEQFLIQKRGEEKTLKMFYRQLWQDFHGSS